MLRILVDTCVWWHWFTFKTAPDRLNAKHLAYSKSFDTVYKLVSSSSNAEFLFNALIKHELGAEYQSEFSEYILPVAKKIVIPLSRCDGLYCSDGSMLRGGKRGGSLSVFLTADGYQQDAMIAKAAAELKTDGRLYKTKPRKRELDVEHMESALEARADLFLTNDESTIIRRLELISGRYDSSHPINLIRLITKTPTDALPYVKKLVEPKGPRLTLIC